MHSYYKQHVISTYVKQTTSDESATEFNNTVVTISTFSSSDYYFQPLFFNECYMHLCQVFW